MARNRRPLTAHQVERLQAPGRHAVGSVAGLHLRILPPPSTARIWILRLVVGSKRRDISLGRYPDVLLDQATIAARQRRSELLGEAAPRAEPPVAPARKSELPAAPIGLTRPVAAPVAAPAARHQMPVSFAHAAEAYIVAHEAGWKDSRHSYHWRRSLALHALPTLGDLEVSAIELDDVLRVLEPIWKTKTETAVKVRGRIELILAWADKRAGVDRPNPARWHGHLDTQLPARSKVAMPRHHRALPVAAMSRFMRALARAQGSAARALHFAILTAGRSTEVRGASWREIDFSSRTWVVPAHRMKGGREHRVPLSAAAIALLEAIPLVDGSDVIFQSPLGGMLSNMALVAVCRRLGEDCVPHGFRSTFRDWCAEHTDAPPEVAEMALAHAIGNEVEAAYRRGDLLVKRRQLMEDWSLFLQADPNPPGRVAGRHRIATNGS